MLLQWKDELEAALRPDLRDPRPGLHRRRGPPRARLRRQPVEHAHAGSWSPTVSDRRDLRRSAARLAGELPPRHAADPRRGAPRRAVQRPEVRHRLEDHPRRPRSWPPASSTACSSPRPRTTATPTASRRCWRSSTPSASAAASGHGRRLLDDVMVRRLKEDIREIQGGFPKRQVVADRHRRPAGRRAGTAALPRCSTSTAASRSSA